jgi:hypothetical protein
LTVPIVVRGHKPNGRLGNKILQFALARKIASDMRVDADLRGFQLDFVSGLCPFVPEDEYKNPLYLGVADCNVPSFSRLRETYVDGKHDAIVLRGWGTRLESLEQSKAVLQNELNSLNLEFVEVDDESILINLRLSEILRQPPVHDDYTPLPVSYYQKVIRTPGKRPVFVGQMTASPYLDDLRSHFPDASFVDLAPMAAFETIRRAHTKVIAMSTFSWLAAWLGSDNTKIFMPLAGAFNPAQRTDWNLTPWSDQRYTFNWVSPLKRHSQSLETHLQDVETSSFSYPQVATTSKPLRMLQIRALTQLGRVSNNLQRRGSGA